MEETLMGVQEKVRVRRSRTEWRRILARFEASGLSETAFCVREGISKGSFSRWKHRVRASEAETAAFVELSPPVVPRSAALEAGELELVLPGGVSLRWKP
jgi:hypothetical protein